jgi:hypothetical protein
VVQTRLRAALTCDRDQHQCQQQRESGPHHAHDRGLRSRQLEAPFRDDRRSPDCFPDESQISFADDLNLAGVIDNDGYVTPALPVIKSVGRTGTDVEIVWSAVSGRTYCPQSEDGLSGSTCPNLPADVYASGDAATITDSNVTSYRLFYRVMVLP